MPGLTSNKQQKLTDSRMPLLVAFCPWGVFLWSFNENKAYSPTLFSWARQQLCWRSPNLTLLLLNTCVQMTEYLMLDRYHHKSQQGEGVLLVDTLRQWRSRWDPLPLWAQLREHLVPALQKNRGTKKKKRHCNLVWEVDAISVLQYHFKPQRLGKMMAISWPTPGKMSICCFIAPKGKQMSLCPCFSTSSILIIYSLSVAELFVISFERHYVQTKELTGFSYYFISFTVTWMSPS